jgi:sulfur-carrier protein adenylyltransferase/sulfurtransferase
VTAALRLLGYDAYSLLYGTPSWGVNDKVKYAFSPAQSGNYPVVKDPAQLEGNFALPAELGDTVEAAAIAYFSGGVKMIKAADVFANLNDGDASNDPVLIDIRSADDYALGHIAGAANIPLNNLFTAETLAKLPPDKQIVVYCYTGQNSGQAVPALRMLGYNATSMTYGLPAWALVEGVSVPVWDNSKSLGQPLEVSATAAAAPAPAAAAPATIPTTGAAFGALFLAGLAAVSAGFALRRR